MAAMSRILTATVLFFEFQSISSLTGYQIQQEEQAGPAQVYAVPNGGPSFTFYGNQNPPFSPPFKPPFNPPFNPNVPRPGAGPFQRPFPPNGHNLIIHNPRFQNYGNGPSNNIPVDAPQPDIPSVKGSPTFIFDAQPPNPQNGGPLLPQRPYQPPAAPLNPRPIPRPNPSDPQMPKSPQSPQPPPKQPAAPKQPSEGTQTEQESGPIINAQNAEMSGGEVLIQHGQVERDTFLYSTQAQILIGTLAAFFSLCALIRCYSKCCWDKVNKRTMDHDTYQQGAAVTRHDTNHIEADVDWSDHTENEDDPLDDYMDDDNAMTDVQQMRSRKARELVPDESVDSGIYSNHDDRSSLEIDRADVQILMDEEDMNNNNNNEQYPLTDDETKAIMKEFKDTDDEYVD